MFTLCGKFSFPFSFFSFLFFLISATVKEVDSTKKKDLIVGKFSRFERSKKESWAFT